MLRGNSQTRKRIVMGLSAPPLRMLRKEGIHIISDTIAELVALVSPARQSPYGRVYDEELATNTWRKRIIHA